VADVASVTLLAEVGAKQLFGKDREDGEKIEGDYMRGRGTFDPSRNPNAYPMTDETRFPSAVTVLVNGVRAGHQALADDPADHRGILSWHSQLQRPPAARGRLVRGAPARRDPAGGPREGRGGRRARDPAGGGRSRSPAASRSTASASAAIPWTRRWCSRSVGSDPSERE
jgi:hypothetical protein